MCIKRDLTLHSLHPNNNISPAPPKGGGAFSEFRAKRVAALQRDLQAAKDATTAESSGNKNATLRPSSVKSHQQDTHHRPGRVPHKGGPRKQNFAEKVLRPASKGQLASSDPNEEAAATTSGVKHSSGIPKLIHRKPVGHQIHDAEQLNAARPMGQRRSGRASARGEMNMVQGDLRRMEKLSNVPARLAPERERRARVGGGYLQQRSSQPYAGLEQNLAKVNEFLSINHYAYNVDNQDDDGYDSDADLELICGPDDPDFIDIDNHEHVKKVGDKYVFDADAMVELTPEEQAQSK